MQTYCKFINNSLIRRKLNKHKNIINILLYAQLDFFLSQLLLEYDEILLLC